MGGAGALPIRRFVVIHRAGSLWGFNCKLLPTRGFPASPVAGMSNRWAGIDDLILLPRSGLVQIPISPATAAKGPGSRLGEVRHPEREEPYRTVGAVHPLRRALV